jgi:hypothetical protein
VQFRLVRGIGITIGFFLTTHTFCVSNTGELIDKLRGGDASAFAELTAVHLIRAKEPTAITELGPEAQVGDRSRKPDFRIRRSTEAWTYVEVTQPDVAEAQRRVEAILTRLVDLVHPIKKGFALEAADYGAAPAPQ